MKRNPIYPSLAMQCDEEAVLKARAFLDMVRLRYELVVSAAYLRAARRNGGGVAYYTRDYCRALDRLWAAQERYNAC
jgi:hypothetical protein